MHWLWKCWKWFPLVVHWPVAFAPGSLMPAHPTKEGYVDIDTTTTLVDTWKAMIELPKSKVSPPRERIHRQSNKRTTLRSSPSVSRTSLSNTWRGSSTQQALFQSVTILIQFQANILTRYHLDCEPSRSASSPSPRRPSQVLQGKGHSYHRI